MLLTGRGPVGPGPGPGPGLIGLGLDGRGVALGF